MPSNTQTQESNWKCEASAGASPVLFLLVQVCHNVQKATDEGAGSGRIG